MTDDAVMLLREIAETLKRIEAQTAETAQIAKTFDAVRRNQNQMLANSRDLFPKL